jgi:hypothetical protein
MTLNRLTKPTLRGAAGLGAVVAAVALAGPAYAHQQIPIFMDTCNSDNQSGDDCVFTTVVENKGGIDVQFVSGDDMCSNVVAHIISDSPQPHEIGQDTLTPGHGGKQYGIPKAASGNSGVSVHVNGIPGGCNTGGLQEWSGQLVVNNYGYSLPPVNPQN